MDLWDVRTKRPIGLHPLPLNVVTQKKVVLRRRATKLVKNADEVTKVSVQVTDDDGPPTDTQQGRLPQQLPPATVAQARLSMGRCQLTMINPIDGGKSLSAAVISAQHKDQGAESQFRMSGRLFA